MIVLYLMVNFLEYIIKRTLTIFFAGRVKAECTAKWTRSVGQQYARPAEKTHPLSVIKSIKIRKRNTVQIGDFFSRRCLDQRIGVAVNQSRDISVCFSVVQSIGQFTHGVFSFADHSDISVKDTHRRFRVGTDDTSANHGDDFRVDLSGNVDHFPDFVAVKAEAAGAHDIDAVGQHQFPQNGIGVSFGKIEVLR